jgi:hypothetical protein
LGNGSIARQINWRIMREMGYEEQEKGVLKRLLIGDFKGRYLL